MHFSSSRRAHSVHLPLDLQYIDRVPNRAHVHVMLLQQLAAAGSALGGPWPIPQTRLRSSRWRRELQPFESMHHKRSDIESIAACAVTGMSFRLLVVPSRVLVKLVGRT